MQHDVKDANVMADINVTPMVDVMLVLLIIFMVVTPALLTGFNPQLPEGMNLKDRPEEDDRTVLGIDRDGRYYLNKSPIERSDAPRLLAAEFVRHAEDRVLFLRADRTVRYGEIIEAMSIGRDAGARVLAAVSQPAPDPADRNRN